MSRIPPRFNDARFDTYRTTSESQAVATKAVKSWIQQLRWGPMLALIGVQGTGKSHLLYSAVKAIDAAITEMDVRDRVGVELPYVAPWYALADQLRYGQTIVTEAGSRFIEPQEVRAKLWDRKIVLLDEVRATSGTSFDDTELAKFACHAYDNRIAVLITTNVNPLSQVIGDAAASRFTQIVIEGPDARQQEVA